MNKYSEACELFDKWSDEGGGKQIINFLTNFITEDTFWLNENISRAHRKTLIELGKFLEMHTGNY